MSRAPRIQYEGAIYHVINRGNYRLDVFQSDRTREAFETCLFEGCAQAGWVLHAHVVMRNHFHLAIETPRANLSEGMHRLETTFAVRFNRYRSEHGHVFQNRYKALLVERGPSLVRVVNYIHLNPVRAGIVPVDQLQQFRWASYRRFVGGERPGCLACDDWLRELGVNDTPEGWLGYQNHLRWRLADRAGQEHERKELTRGWAIGSPSWKRDTALKYRHLLGRHRLKASELVELKELEWAEALNGMLEKSGRTKQDALHQAKGSGWKIALARQLRLTTTATNGWIGRQLHMGSASSVSVYLCQTKKHTP